MEISRIVVELLSLAVTVVGSATRPWWRLVWFAVCLYISVWTTVFAWGLRLLRVPRQLIGAPAREQQMASRLAHLQAQYEDLQIMHSQLERNHKSALHEHRQMQHSLQAAVISEVNKATQRSKLLKLRVRELEEQNLKLQAVERRKSLTHDLHPPEKDVEIDLHNKADIVETSSTADLKQNTIALKPVPQATTHGFPAKTSVDVGGRSCTLMDHQTRGTAFASSLFSATLSALVAVIVWNARDPCMPLIIALFTVVGMSCVNVVRFVLKSSHWFDLDAILLVSFNSFILGTLASPFLPYFAPAVMNLWWWLLGWFGLKPEVWKSEPFLNMFPTIVSSPEEELREVLN